MEVSGSEELVGGRSQEMVGLGLVQKYNIRVHRLCVRALRARGEKCVISLQK